MPEVSVFSAKSGSKIGNFTFPRIPVKGDILDMPTHPQFEVVRVTLYTERLYGFDVPIVQVIEAGSLVPSDLRK